MRGSECGLSLHVYTNIGSDREVSANACREWKAASSNSFDVVCTSSHLIDWSHSGGIFIVPC